MWLGGASQPSACFTIQVFPQEWTDIAPLRI
jgi:hypothetical protein